MLEELYEENLIGDPQTLEEEEEQQIGGSLFFENDENDQTNFENEINDIEAQTLPQSNNVVQPKQKRVVKNPLPKLDGERLKGARGIAILENVFADYKFCGKGHEREDLDQIMKRLEHWAHRLFPKYQFDDSLRKIETLGHKKPVMTYIKKIRMGMETAEAAAVDQKNLGTGVVDDETDLALPLDPFDNLISQQIAEVHATASTRTSPNTDTPTSSSPLRTPKTILTAEQRERMERNRKIALERRLARIKAQQNHGNFSSSSKIASLDQDKTAPSTSDKTSNEVSEIEESFSEETSVPSSEQLSLGLPKTSHERNENDSISLIENMNSDSHEVHCTSVTSVTYEEPLLIVQNSTDIVQSYDKDASVDTNVNVDTQNVCAIPSQDISPNKSPLHKGEGITLADNVITIAVHQEKVSEIDATDN